MLMNIDIDIDIDMSKEGAVDIEDGAVEGAEETVGGADRETVGESVSGPLMGQSSSFGFPRSD
jgi:hypothetical protein